MKKGDKIKIIHMDDGNGKDYQASMMKGVIGIISFIDDAGQIHLEGYGLAIIPGVDTYINLDSE